MLEYDSQVGSDIMNHDKQCGAYIKHISDVLQRDCNNTLQKKGLTLSQLSVLVLLEDSPNKELSLKEIEKQLHVAQSTAAGIISRLTQKKFVECFYRENDKRVKVVKITEDGHKCFIDSQADAHESETYLLKSLTKEEQIQLNALLKKVSENL